MQQRGNSTNTSLNSEDGDQQNVSSSRGRPTSKLRVLGRSHAMREEASPPREPPQCQSNPNQQQLQSPCIKLTPSPEPSIQGKPVLVLSPSPDRTEDPENPLQAALRTEDVSPSSTLVPTPNSRCSPLHHEHHHQHLPCGERLMQQHHSSESDQPPSPKYLNSPDKERSSHSSNSLRKNRYCDCQNQNCIKCVKDRSTSVNNVNNNHSNVNNNVISSPNMLYVSRGGSARAKLRQQSSSQGSYGSFESSSMSPCLSRDNSSEQYTDFGGVDLEQFIPETLNRNAKDRALMLRIEQELVTLARDRIKTHYKFPPMSSYQRMLVHRCAAYFGMDHNIEPSGKCVVVNKTKNTRIPEVEFREHIKDDIVFTEEPRRSILKRDSNSIEDYCFKSPDRGYNNSRSKSFEEREEEYEKVRRRIFNREMHEGTSEDSGWSEIPWSSTESEYISKYRLQPPELQARHLRRLLKVHSEDTAEALRPCVAKSFSFGGYGGGNVSLLTRGDSVMSTHSAGPRLLTKQDSGASSCVSWRLSPLSSGYKSQSQMSESVTPSPTNTPHLGGDEGAEGPHRNKPDSHLVWAVTDIHSVPKGSIIINPETGKPLKNDDGTIYHYDPYKPPPGFFTQPTPPPPSKVDATSSPQRSPHGEDRRSPQIQLQRSPPRELQRSPQREVQRSPQREIRRSPPREVRRSPPREVVTRSPHRENASQQKPSLSRCSPPRKQSSFTNSATSPSLPYSPPLSTCSSAVHPGEKNCPYLQTAPSCENVTNLPQQPPHYPNYNTTPTESNNAVPAVYPQPYIVYTAPYGVPVQQQFDGRLDPPSITPDLATTYYMTEGAPQTPSQPIATYPSQPPPFWNQAPPPVGFYPGAPSHQASATPPQRYSVAVSAQGQPIYMPNGYPQAMNYLTQPGAPAQCQSQDMVPVYPGQPVQMVYANQPSTPTPVIYTQNPVVYSTTPAYPPQAVPPYPQSAPTPNSCNSSVSTQQFGAGAVNQPTDLSAQQQGYIQLTHSMHQMALGAVPQAGTPRGFMAFNIKYSPPFDQRPCTGSKSGTPRYPSQPRGSFTGCSGQNSGGTNSPAGTVIGSTYCPQSAGAPGIPPPYRTPSNTPPTPQFLSFQPGFTGAPRLFRQISGGRESTPGTDRNSRSPTPASDITHFDRPRISLPPNFYQGMPYILQSDPRFFGRGQPQVYRQTPPTLSRQSSLNQDSNRSQNNKGRKPRGSKQGGLPPSGK